MHVVCSARTRQGVQVALKVFDLEAVLKHDLVRNKGKQGKGLYWEVSERATGQQGCAIRGCKRAV